MCECSLVINHCSHYIHNNSSKLITYLVVVGETHYKVQMVMHGIILFVRITVFITTHPYFVFLEVASGGLGYSLLCPLKSVTTIYYEKIS